MKPACSLFLLVFALVAGCAGPHATPAGPFDPATLRARYDRNNEAPVPVVEYMINAYPVVLIYPDGLFLSLADSALQSSSGLLVAHLSPAELTNILAEFSSRAEFWTLDDRYQLTDRTDQAVCHVAVRIPGHPEKTVVVYGRIANQHLGDLKPPAYFVDFVAALCRLRPDGLKPWNPGYVEIHFNDYHSATGRSLRWPGEWPSLNGPLVREAAGQKIMLFPSELVPQLDLFLAKRSDYSPVLINGRKTFVEYRWPMPGEKKWTPFQ